MLSSPSLFPGMKYSSDCSFCKRFLAFLFLSFMIFSFYVISLKTISANREEPVIAFKSLWFSDQSRKISLGKFSISINKLPPKLVFEVGDFKIPFILFPQHGPLSSIPPYLMYKVGPEYSVAFMRLTGVLLGIFILILLLKDSLILPLLLYTNAFLLFVFSYTSLFWYVCMLLFCVLYLKNLNTSNKYLIFLISFLGTLSHIRFFMFSLVFSLIFLDLKRIFWALLGSFLGFFPYLILSFLHKGIQIDKSSLEVLFAPASDITVLILDYIFSARFELFNEILSSIKSFTYLFFSLAPFSDLGIIRTQEHQVLKFLSITFFIFVLFFGLLRSGKSIRYVLFLVCYIIIFTLSNPLGLFGFTKIPWAFLLILPIFYSFILGVRKVFVYLVVALQAAFSFFVLWNFTHSKTQFSKSQIREVIDFLEARNIRVILNVGTLSSIPFESAGKIKTVEGLYFFYTKHPLYDLKIFENFEYIIVSDETEKLMDRILITAFDPIFTTSGNSIKVYKKKRSF